MCVCVCVCVVSALIRCFFQNNSKWPESCICLSSKKINNWKVLFNYNVFNSNEKASGASKFWILSSPLPLPLPKPALPPLPFQHRGEKKFTQGKMQMNLQAITMLMRFTQRSHCPSIRNIFQPYSENIRDWETVLHPDSSVSYSVCFSSLLSNSPNERLGTQSSVQHCAACVSGGTFQQRKWSQNKQPGLFWCKSIKAMAKFE